MRTILRASFFLLAATTFATEAIPGIKISGPENETICETISKEDDQQWAALLLKGRNMLSAGDTASATKDCLNPIITHYEKTYANSPKDIFCTDDNTVTLFYLMSAALAADLEKENIPENLMPKIFAATGRDTRKTKSETIVLPSTWAEAYYLKSYALVEQQNITEAQKYLKKALYLSPCNATYWSELGHTHQMLKNWDQCLHAFQMAEDAADHSAEECKEQDQARAWRGIAYVYIETGKLIEAEKLYRKCLKLNPGDKTAKSELQYIEKLRAKKQQP